MRRPSLIALAVTVAALAALPADRAEAARRRPPAPPKPPPVEWTLAGAARFEPLDPATPMTSTGDGDYRGALEVVRQPGGAGLAVINRVGFEDYLKGISEIPVEWPFEVQKAQAIAARTYALWEMQARPASAPWRAAGADICASQACQVYAGLGKERREGAANWTAAVEATRNEVIVFKGGPIAAKYSSSNGGQTVPGSYPYLRAIADPDDAHSPLHRWQVSIPLEQVASALALPAVPTAIWREGDYVHFAHVDAEGATRVDYLPAADVRDRLNATVPEPEGVPLTIPSVRFAVRAAPDQGLAVVEGRGFGHGVGMSQFGALGKALRGMKAPDILAAYYAGLKPAPAHPSLLPATVKVAIGLDRRVVTVTSPGPFRILDGDGDEVVPAARGSWVVRSGPDGVVLRPPADQAALALDVQPAGAAVAGRPLRLTVRASLPARVRITTQATGAVVELDVAAGATTPVELAPASAPGAHAVTVEADAGAGRVAATPLTVAVTAAAAPAGAPDGPARPSGPPDGAPLGVPLRVAAAALLLAAAMAAFTYALRPTPRRPVH